MRVVYLGHNPVFAKVLADAAALAGVYLHGGSGGIGRRGRITERFCRETGVPVRHLERFDSETERRIREDRPDLLITGEFHLFVPRRIREIPSLGALNLHGSLLPAYRGTQPLRWMVIEGETLGGATVHFLDGRIDAGPIVEQDAYPIGPEDPVPVLRGRYETCGASLLRRALDRFVSGPVEGIPQDESSASYYPDRKPEDGRIDWDQPPRRVYDFIRALSDLDVCAFSIGPAGRILLRRVSRSFPGGEGGGDPGTVVECGDGGFTVRCRGGGIRILDWEPAGTATLPPVGGCFEGMGGLEDVPFSGASSGSP